MKKKGFTLIELLAVIVILAIILVIAVPQILNVIEKSEMQAFKESVELMVYTAKMQYQMGEVNNTSKEIPEEGITYIYGERNNETMQTNKDDVGLLNFKGDKPSSGTITLTKERKVRVEKLVSKNKKYCAIKEEDSNEVKVGRATSEEYGCIIEEVKDKTACELEEDKAGETLYVDSVSDLYELSRSVNNGNTYEGKVIKLRTNLDMNNTSYSTTCGEESFKPIGTSSHPFKGTFDGGAYTISNLTINMPGSDNVGIFGYVTNATIYGLIIDNINVTGNNYVGSLVGYDNIINSTGSTIKEIVAKDIIVTGNSTIGGIIGYASSDYDSKSSKYNNIIIKNETITATSSSLGPIVGKYNYISSKASKSIVENYTSILSGGNQQYSDDVTSNVYYKPTDVDEINFYDSIGLDTWIGGDNDNSGYYFDYDNWINSNSKIVLKSIKDNPITFNLKGAGTQDNPYLVSSANDWKDMTSRTAISNIYYKLINDIDFKNKKFYQMGNGVNKVTGITLEGGAKKISNATIKVSKKDNVGIFGYVTNATIYGLIIDNINVTGNNYVGSLVGYDNIINSTGSTIKEIVAKDIIVTGNSTIGGIIGYASSDYDIRSSKYNNIIIKNETIASTSSSLAPIVGKYNYTSSKVKKSIVENYISTLAGENQQYSDDTINKVYYKPEKINDLEYYESIGMDTSINGDNDSSGYYFDYVDSLNGIYVVEAK